MNTKEDLKRWIEIQPLLHSAFDKFNDANRELQTLRREADVIKERYGKCGRVFNIDGVLVQSRRSNDYAGLEIINPEVL